MPYNEKLDAQEQIDAEEWIADHIFNGDSYEDARWPSEEECANMGRDILNEVLRRFRPDLLQGAAPELDPDAVKWLRKHGLDDEEGEPK